MQGRIDKLYTNQIPGRTIRHQSGEFLYFSGTSYLGLGQLPEFKELIKQGIDRVGTHFGGSRLSNIELSIFNEAEERLKNMLGAERAMLLSSGTLAGYMLSLVVNRNAEFLVAPGTHSALWSHFSPPFEGNIKDWKAMAAEKVSSTKGSTFILTNTTDPLFCSSTDLDWLESVHPGGRISLIADDSHGIGLRGIKKDPLYRDWSSRVNGEAIFMGSLGKGMGLPAGFVAGPETTIKNLRRTNSFGGSSPPNPAFLHAWLKGENLYELQLEKLMGNIRFFHSLIDAEKHFHFLPDYPVFHVKSKGLENYLLSRGMVISSFNYPGPDDPVVTRVVLNALHSSSDLNRLCEAIEAFEKEE